MSNNINIIFFIYYSLGFKRFYVKKFNKDESLSMLYFIQDTKIYYSG